MGIFAGFIDDKEVELHGVEPMGRGEKLGDHAATLTHGEEGVMHGYNSIMLKDADGEPAPVYSIASGIDYPSVGPEHAYLQSIGRTIVGLCNDTEAIDAFYKLSQLEGIIPALESAHAVAYAMKLAKTMSSDQTILINLSGRGDKDIDFVVENYPIPNAKF
jgi:tryptophan synthase beta chain